MSKMRKDRKSEKSFRSWLVRGEGGHDGYVPAVNSD